MLRLGELVERALRPGAAHHQRARPTRDLDIPKRCVAAVQAHSEIATLRRQPVVVGAPRPQEALVFAGRYFEGLDERHALRSIGCAVLVDDLVGPALGDLHEWESSVGAPRPVHPAPSGRLVREQADGGHDSSGSGPGDTWALGW